MFNTNGYSLSDIAAVSGNNRNNDDMFGNNGAWWIIVLFLFARNNGWGDNNGNGNNGALTRGELCQDMNFADLETAIRGVQSGLCDGFYAMNTGMLNGFSGLQNSLTSEFRGLDNAICTLGYQTQAGINSVNVANAQNTNAIQTQLADCCCKAQSAIKDLATQNVMSANALSTQIANCCCDVEKMNMQNRFDAQQNTCNTLQAIEKMGDRIVDYMCQRDTQALRDENLALKFAASQAAQNTYLVDKIRPCPDPAYIVPNPYCNCNGGYPYYNIA